MWENSRCSTHENLPFKPVYKKPISFCSPLTCSCDVYYSKKHAINHAKPCYHDWFGLLVKINAELLNELTRNDM